MAAKPNVVTMGKLHLFDKVMGGDNPANADSLADSAESVRNLGLVKDKGTTDAFYPAGAKPHNHHLQDADAEIAMATWGIGEGSRQAFQENLNKDETINKG